MKGWHQISVLKFILEILTFVEPFHIAEWFVIAKIEEVVFGIPVLLGGEGNSYL